MNITKLNVCTPTTSKISEENPTSSDTILNCVKTGKVEPSLPAMKKDARDCNHVPSAMDGRSNNSIHLFIRLNHAKSQSASRDLNAHSTTVLRTEGIPT